MKIQIRPIHTTLVITLLLGCFALLRAVQAVVPAPDGGYPGGNTAEGHAALLSLTTGAFNTAVGFLSLRSNTDGSFNTAVGAGALLSNVGNQNMVQGIANTAVGAGALLSNTTGRFNTAVGANALLNNNTGDNTAIGHEALFSNILGFRSTAVGRAALRFNVDGVENTAHGVQALFSNIDGDRNTAIGINALVTNTSGSDNTTIGYESGFDITGNGNVCIGDGVRGGEGENNHTRIRNIGSTSIVGGTNVVLAATGGLGDQILGYASSSRRYKEEIKPMEKASETLFALKPVTFRAKGNITPSHVKHYGLVAEDVAAVDSDLVVYSPEGKPETLRFDSINAMLLNEFLKEHRKVEKLEATVADLASQLRRVSAQVQMNDCAGQVATSGQ
jgi:hypothetical protein